MSGNKQLSVQSNKVYHDNERPYFSIIMPLYNRANIVDRALLSVMNQTFRDFEYIIIDDGSNDNPDYKISEFLKNANFPCLYIKKENGGVHTARNIGIKYARGKLEIFLDSDDELLPTCLQTAYDEWNAIPKEEVDQCFQLKGRCKDQNGNIVGMLFPDNINEMPNNDRVKIAKSIRGEQVGIRPIAILKENPWPEPDGVKFVSENILWGKLDRVYKSYYTNSILQIYHSDGEDHISSINKTQKHMYSIQQCRDTLWNLGYSLNNSKLYISNWHMYCRFLLIFVLMKNVLKIRGDSFQTTVDLHGTAKALSIMAYPLGRVAAPVFIKKRCDK